MFNAVELPAVFFIERPNIFGIVTRHVMNPSADLALISIIRSSYNNNNIDYKIRDKRRAIITSLVTISSSDVSGRILDHVLKYGAVTIPELEFSLMTTKASASRTLKKLISCSIVRVFGFVGLPYRDKSPGPRVPIYSLVGADPEVVNGAQRRYGEIQLSLKSPSMRQSQLAEAVAYCKVYMVERGIKAIPDMSILIPLMKAGGFEVKYPLLINGLAKEGFKWR